jgi:tetratricopeptide (TPR) repeat protein
VTKADFKEGDQFSAVERHLADLEDALKTALPSMTPVASEGDATYVLVDSPIQVLVGSISVTTALKASNSTAKKIWWIADPYPQISLFLGSYYNEKNRQGDALRVLNAGIAASDIDGVGLGIYDSLLLSEKGIALEGLKRYDEALAALDRGLALKDLDPRDRARLYRGRGFVYTELGKLEEAERAYNDSLTCEPGNERALHELAYIAQLRSGAAPTATIITTVPPPKSDAPQPANCTSQ